MKCSYSLDVRYDSNQQYAERKGLIRQHKKERKGAIKEVLNESKFTATQQLRERKRHDKQYAKWLSGVEGMLASEKGEARMEERMANRVIKKPK